ncbi:hypothetical protein HDU96_002976 [Phlyctochytrium bullatum]|nr:hypothetical protein HDU96_002976 [Phlyctochytrium bullatum]
MNKEDLAGTQSAAAVLIDINIRTIESIDQEQDETAIQRKSAASLPQTPRWPLPILPVSISGEPPPAAPLHLRPYPLLTPCDDLTPLPSLEMHNALFAMVASFWRTAAATPSSKGGSHRSSPSPCRPSRSMFGRTAEAEALFQRAAKDVFLALLGLSGTTSKGAMLTVLQIYRFFCVLCTPESPDARWLALAVACVNQIAFCAEDDQLTDPDEEDLRRRVWWFLYLCDAFLALTTHMRSHIFKSLCAHLHVMGSELAQQHPVLPLTLSSGTPLSPSSNSPPQPPTPSSLHPRRPPLPQMRRHPRFLDSTHPPDLPLPLLRAHAASTAAGATPDSQHHTRGDARLSSAGNRRIEDSALDVMLLRDASRACLHLVLGALAQMSFAFDTAIDMGSIFDAEPLGDPPALEPAGSMRQCRMCVVLDALEPREEASSEIHLRGRGVWVYWGHTAFLEVME